MCIVCAVAAANAHLSMGDLDELVELVHALDALLVAVAERVRALLLRLPEHARHRVQTCDTRFESAQTHRTRREERGTQTLIEVLERRPERQPNEVVARRVEEVPAVGGVDVEEDARDDDRLLLEELLEERQTVVERRGEVLEVEPDVERRDGRHGDVQADLVEPLQDVVALGLEVPLERDLLCHDALGLEQRDRGELEPRYHHCQGLAHAL